jgi:hypothetical protein
MEIYRKLGVLRRVDGNIREAECDMGSGWKYRIQKVEYDVDSGWKYTGG